MNKILVKYLLSLSVGSFIAVSSFDVYLNKLGVGKNSKEREALNAIKDILESEIEPDVADGNK